MKLFEDYKAGRKAAKLELLQSLNPLLQHQVRKFENSGLPRPALELEAKRLASQAIDTYDPNKGAKLNTHVVNYGKKMSRFVTSYQNVGHIPEPRALMIGKYQTIFENIESDKGREPTIIELSDAMQVSPAEIERLQSELRRDLSMTLSEDEDSVGFHFFAEQDAVDPKLKQIIDFVYYDADPIDKKIMEYTMRNFFKGTTMAGPLTAKQMAHKLKLSPSELKTRKEKLSKEIEALRT